MEPSRIVEILQDGKSRGTGYLLTPNHVLTARHVVNPEVVGTACTVRPLCAGVQWVAPPAQDQRPDPVAAEVGWTSAYHDLALIRVTGEAPTLYGTATLPFGQIPADDGAQHKVQGAGFPAASGIDQRSIAGDLTWVLTEPRRFDIDVESAIPRDWRKWAGFSGAAVFARGLLVGVVRTVAENWNGGVLEATPAAWLLEDPGFRHYCGQWGIALPARLYAGEVDPTVPLECDLPSTTEGLLRFSHYNPRVPFFGRSDALSQLEAFLTCEAGRPFAWWMVTGGGGVGKTRLARHLCRNMPQPGWHAGFLPRKFNANTAALDAWTPRVPTLIVADYVMANIDQVHILADRLARRQAPPKLRLLLLEREASELFESHFLGPSDTERVWIAQARYSPPAEPAESRQESVRDRLRPLRLGELAEDDLWTLVKGCPWQAIPVPLGMSREAFFRELGQLDSQRRPLIAMILADALTTSVERAGLGGLQTQLRDLLVRERNRIWPEILKVADTRIGKAEADVAIAFATMIDGLGKPELSAIEAARGLPIDPEILPACSLAIGKPLRPMVARLERLEPDMIGEFFALETLCGDPNNAFVEPPHSWMSETAWRTNGSAMADFVLRSKQNFPKSSRNWTHRHYAERSWCKLVC